ncbi:MAG: 4Fe-4S dicluster domain-containing protein [Ignavibacteriaceae bacterium]|nr:4Fe-4S dicluster domain-containing protein [Ignavibacteriaceae bacterium]
MNIIKTAVFVPLFIGAIVFFTLRCLHLIKILKTGRPEDRFDNIPQRLKNVFIVAIAQSKLFREPLAGTLHALIFWGFVLFLFAVIEAIIQGFYAPFSLKFLGPLFGVITVIQDVFGILVIGSVLFAAYRRYIQKVKRLQVDAHGSKDAAFILGMILVVVVSMFGQNISHVAMHGLSGYEFRPLSAPLAASIFGSGNAGAGTLYEVFWWIHIVAIFAFLNYLPYSKHLHVLTSVPNVYFGNVDEKKNTIKPINLEDEKNEFFGVKDLEQFTWKQIFDSFSCTECGRCTSVCPANTVGKLLSPRKIITDIRDRAFDKGTMLVKGVNEGEVFEKTHVPDYTTEQELWACTTCMACVQECPVSIEHVDSIVDMRRNLVLMESSFPPELNNTFRSLENNFSPWAFDPSERGDWANGMDIRTMSEDSSGEYLFWVGCAGSYDNRYKKVSQAFASIMQKGGIDFRILGSEEKCNGDTARRLGNEYLAQEMMKSNIETLNGYGVKKIVTACPHCYNSLKNEYKQFGGNFEVKHHSELISELIESGKISVKENSVKEKVTFHDSCYIGRYNDIYEEPRKAILSAAGSNVVEMERNKSKGFCCGAGGGRMFMEDHDGGKVNVERTREAIETGAGTIGTACPFCMTMMNDGLKAHDKSEEMQVKDIAEIVYENLK